MENSMPYSAQQLLGIKKLNSRMTRVKNCTNPKAVTKQSTGSVHTWD
ncbi:hypothetical protein [Spirosoma endophyticum]|uniref:Uncharacterized protein n=1 Tax=Spirosoma endophyticum TaxID=662367 RepID=A0A1I2BCX7_9BACT|nr:hypothetical protein [Spirosoma endophyticum]SFE53956.1 hypothetical protein SAMN05216167_11564 [Spirosoma endophyticum]